jgi:hypothetical protein
VTVGVSVSVGVLLAV